MLRKFEPSKSITAILIGVASCKIKLEEQIRAVERDPSLTDNPISFTIDLQASRQSANPVEKSNAEIIELLSLLYTQVRELASNVKLQMLQQLANDAYSWKPDSSKFAMSREALHALGLSDFLETPVPSLLLQKDNADKRD
jgi:hypothetical protein